MNGNIIGECLETLRSGGSLAAPGFMRPEGIVIYHHASGGMFKVLFENDELPKGVRDSWRPRIGALRIRTGGYDMAMTKTKKPAKKPAPAEEAGGRAVTRKRGAWTKDEPYTRKDGTATRGTTITCPWSSRNGSAASPSSKTGNRTRSSPRRSKRTWPNASATRPAPNATRGRTSARRMRELYDV